MSKPIKPQDNQANIQNSNKGTAGTNKQHDQAVGNTGKQKNPLPNDAHLPKLPAQPKSKQ